MLLQLSDIRSELQDRLKNRTIGTTRLDRWANLAQDRIAMRIDPDHLLVEEDVATTASSRFIYLSYDYNKITQGINLDQDTVLAQPSTYQLDKLDPDRSEISTVSAFTQCENSWVKAQPSSASVITIVSSSASDTTQKVRVNGIVGGVEDTELITLNGTSSAAGSKSFTSVSTVVKNSTTAGNVTVTSNSGAVTLAQIPAFLLGKSYNKVEVWPQSNTAENLRFRGYRKPRKMINVEDHPELPELWHEAVLIQAEIIGNRDLFRIQMANNIEERVLEPMIKELLKQMGNRRRIKSPVLAGTATGMGQRDWGRLGTKYGE